MNICIFDTETTSLDKPFCYNVGYVIADTENREILVRRSYVVEQIWHNLPLFQSAYYADKRPLYISAMRARTTIMDKFGYICQQMIRDFKAFNIEIAYAYNSSFDEKVFAFNCDWYKCNNPFDNISVKDIRAFALEYLVKDDYKNFCDKYEYYTDNGNYSTTAETVYRFVFNDTNFIEAHTALNDSEIEAKILFACIDAGADFNGEYKGRRFVERIQEKELHIKDRYGDDWYFEYSKIRMNKNKTEITLK